MAFKIRTEFWDLAENGNAYGLDNIFLKQIVASAQEFEASSTTEEPEELPVPANRAGYAMCIIGIEGAATVAIGPEDTVSEDPADGRLVTEGSEESFIVQPDSFIFITEYVIGA